MIKEEGGAMRLKRTLIHTQQFNCDCSLFKNTHTISYLGDILFRFKRNK